jgi:predicted porin
MKKTLLALAALTAFAGAASAQSSVTLFGIVDAAYGHVSAGGRSVTGISNSGLNSSRLGFRGVEDIGGGMRAGFWLEGQLSNDDGNAAGLNFQRRSTVSLMGNFGEIRLGRDYTPSFWNTTVYDAFGTNGVGQAMTPGMISVTGIATNTTAVRSNNTIAYFLPGGLGGFTGQVQYGFGEVASNAANAGQGNYFGFRLGYAAGPLSAHYAYGNVKGVSGATNVKTSNIGASYDFGAVKTNFFWGNEKAGTGAKVSAWELSGVAPMGAGELRAAYSRYDVANSANDWNKFALGYGYNLSKRTQLYTTYARVSNKGTQNRSVSNNGLSAGLSSAGGSSTGYEFGIRHSF